MNPTTVQKALTFDDEDLVSRRIVSQYVELPARIGRPPDLSVILASEFDLELCPSPIALVNEYLCDNSFEGIHSCATANLCRGQSYLGRDRFSSLVASI